MKMKLNFSAEVCKLIASDLQFRCSLRWTDAPRIFLNRDIAAPET